MRMGVSYIIKVCLQLLFQGTIINYFLLHSLTVAWNCTFGAFDHCTFNFILCSIIFLEDIWEKKILGLFFLSHFSVWKPSLSFQVCGCDLHSSKRQHSWRGIAEWIGEKENLFWLLLLISLFPALAVSLLAKVVPTQDCCQKCSTILSHAFLHLPCGVAVVMCKLLRYHAALQLLVTAGKAVKIQRWGMARLPLLIATDRETTPKISCESQWNECLHDSII